MSPTLSAPTCTQPSAHMPKAQWGTTCVIAQLQSASAAYALAGRIASTRAAAAECGMQHHTARNSMQASSALMQSIPSVVMPPSWQLMRPARPSVGLSFWWRPGIAELHNYNAVKCFAYTQKALVTSCHANTKALTTHHTKVYPCRHALWAGVSTKQRHLQTSTVPRASSHTSHMQEVKMPLQTTPHTA
jgi:hypothetical protein